MEELNFLKEQNVDPGLVAQVRDFRRSILFPRKRLTGS